MKRIAIIPARGGSRRIPHKNIREFRGRPIIEYSIATALDSKLFDEVVVSTDDDDIAKVATKAMAQVMWRVKDDGLRGTQEVAREVLLQLKDVKEACVIYATSPLLLVEDLVVGLNALNQPGVSFAMSVSDPLADAGCFYWGKAHAFRNGVPLIAPHTAMVPLPASRVCDINTLADWSRATYLYDALRRAQP